MLKKAAFYILAVLAGSVAAVVGNSLYNPASVLQDEEVFHSYHDQQDVEVYYFYSDECHFCQQLKPYINDLAAKREIKTCNVASMDEECASLASSLGLKYVPAMVVRADRDYVFVGYSEVMNAIKQLGGMG